LEVFGSSDEHVLLAMYLAELNYRSQELQTSGTFVKNVEIN